MFKSTAYSWGFVGFLYRLTERLLLENTIRRSMEWHGVPRCGIFMLSYLWISAQYTFHEFQTIDGNGPCMMLRTEPMSKSCTIAWLKWIPPAKREDCLLRMCCIRKSVPGLRPIEIRKTRRTTRPVVLLCTTIEKRVGHSCIQ